MPQDDITDRTCTACGQKFQFVDVDKQLPGTLCLICRLRGLHTNDHGQKTAYAQTFPSFAAHYGVRPGFVEDELRRITRGMYVVVPLD